MYSNDYLCLLVELFIFPLCVDHDDQIHPHCVDDQILMWCFNYTAGMA